MAEQSQTWTFGNKTYQQIPSLKSTELVINFHMTEACNYGYATWEASCGAKELHRSEGAIENLIDSRHRGQVLHFAFSDILDK